MAIPIKHQPSATAQLILGTGAFALCFGIWFLVGNDADFQ
jgi:hypothetical protein